MELPNVGFYLRQDAGRLDFTSEERPHVLIGQHTGRDLACEEGGHENLVAHPDPIQDPRPMGVVLIRT